MSPMAEEEEDNTEEQNPYHHLSQFRIGLPHSRMDDFCDLGGLCFPLVWSLVWDGLNLVPDNSAFIGLGGLVRFSTQACPSGRLEHLSLSVNPITCEDRVNWYVSACSWL
ncbi:DEAD-box ATP-dependent RNA helicase [Actinidia chinensis var. chinensis]|uniref:DEAD-box ATP-dependent RNA helicase n=1 Tax=Actinidia chinensis var. chinensis TaxID=1590841 RepID=A0A2R6Q8H2_ACTCC|nr:DEAD-box ATP-dependent RNA helicase [Actinidia chinensis var. chinensis]